MSKIYSEEDLRRASGAPSVRNENEEGRTAFQKDYARLIHAPSFRRLQGKTQLFPGHEDDFFRNRLTHSLEVAQISSGVANRVNLHLKKMNATERINIDLVEFAAIAHDLGHPPFGHNGEAALDELMSDDGGFEGNAQTLHILASVEAKRIIDGNGDQSDKYGLDLTYRTLASVLKYDQLIPRYAKDREKIGLVKGYYKEEEKLVIDIKSAVAPGYQGKFKTIECSIMDVADDIAYSTYDLEDSLHARFVTPTSLLHCLFVDAELRTSVLEETNRALIKAGHKELESDTDLFEHAIRVIGYGALTGDVDGSLSEISNTKTQTTLNAVQRFAANENWLTDPVTRTSFTAERVGRLIGGIEFDFNEKFPMLSKVRLARNEMLDVEILKHLNYQLVIRSHRLAIPERRGKDIVKKIFNTLVESKGELLDDYWKVKYKAAASKNRVICDYVSGMTDRHAVELHDAFFGAGKTIFKPH